jgi:hypothetical protein
MTQEPGSVWSEFRVRVAYTVRFTDREGRELGSVRLERSSESASVAPPQQQLEEAFRSALADSFEALARSSALRGVLEGLRG